MATIIQFLCLACLAAAVPTQFKCPDWPLPMPWGSVKGTLDENDVCIYADIRYASPPVGPLRFRGPEYPPKANPAAPGPYPSCIQATDVKCAPGMPLEDIPGEAGTCFPKYFGTQSEDCLFLDVYVPKEVFEKNLVAPVVVWFYGGAYLFGSKTQYNPKVLPFYDGSGPLGGARTANKNTTNAIFVRGNYRLGAFGWLAGAYMEKNGQPNAGLLDQRAILEFVRDRISGVRGNPKAVSVWGESAGASSIMHHLVMEKNIREPLFQKAILQSPAFQWLWARSGDLNSTFTSFAEAAAKLAKCKKADMACLQTADTLSLQKANQRIFQRKACDGIIPIGPSIDGSLIKTLAPNSLRLGKAMTLESIIVSHVDLEVPYVNSTDESTFVPLPVRRDPKNPNSFDKFLQDVFAGDAYVKVREDIKNRYPSKDYYNDQIARSAAVITDSSFTCNTRFIIDRYIAANSKVYAMNYALASKANASTHASDLLPLFANAGDPKTDYKPLIRCIKNVTDFDPEVDIFADSVADTVGSEMQQYFMDHAIWGDPNRNRKQGNADIWPLATNTNLCPDRTRGTCVWNVMRVDIGTWFTNNKGADSHTPSSTCGFWSKLAEDIAKISGQEVGREPFGDSEQIVLKEEI